jgi:hypothetical protein
MTCSWFKKRDGFGTFDPSAAQCNKCSLRLMCYLETVRRVSVRKN